jgi:hypothetical protein
MVTSPTPHRFQSPSLRPLRARPTSMPLRTCWET